MKLDESMKSNIVFGAAGIVMGLVSPAISRATGFPAYVLVPLVIMIFAVKIGLEKMAKIKQPKGWWFSNGVLLCILVWFIIWTVLYNLS